MVTSPSSFVVFIRQVIAPWWAHAPRGFFPVLNGGDAGAREKCRASLRFAVANCVQRVFDYVDGSPDPT